MRTPEEFKQGYIEGAVLIDYRSKDFVSLTESKLDKNKPLTKKTKKSGVYQLKREKGISGVINGGGSNLTFKTLNGDILIRY